MPKVSVQLLLWNGKQYLDKALASLAAQTFSDFELLVFDNGSTDGSAVLAEKLLEDFPRRHRFIRMETNIGFAGGHNRLFALSESEYVFLVNQDVAIAPDYLEKIVGFLDADPHAGSAAGKLLKEDGSVDSLGLAKTWYEKVYDITDGAGDAPKLVYGVSGALPVYRRAAVSQATPDGKLFDETFFAYKEDVDLARRLRLFGWTAFTVSSALATHFRGFGKEKKGDPALAWRQQLSSRNHLLALVKCLPPRDFWKIPFLIVYESAKAAYLAVFLPSTLAYLPEFFAMLPNARKVRKVIWSRLRAPK